MNEMLKLLSTSGTLNVFKQTSSFILPDVESLFFSCETSVYLKKTRVITLPSLLFVQIYLK